MIDWFSLKGYVKYRKEKYSYIYPKLFPFPITYQNKVIAGTD